MDLVRHYYADQNMTAPAYRLEYIYKYTHGPNLMREFMISTAAFRALEEAPRSAEMVQASPMLHQTFYAPGSYLSESLRGVLEKNPEMATDFIQVSISLAPAIAALSLMIFYDDVLTVFILPASRLCLNFTVMASTMSGTVRTANSMCTTRHRRRSASLASESRGRRMVPLTRRYVHPQYLRPW